MAAHFSARQRLLLFAGLLAMLAVPAFGLAARQSPAVQRGAAELLISTSPDVSQASRLHGRALSGAVYVALRTAMPLRGARFLLDATAAEGAAQATGGTQLQIPYVEVGHAAAAKQGRPFDTHTLADGRHTLTALLEYEDGSIESVNVPFLVANADPVLTFSVDPLQFAVPVGDGATTTIEINTSDGAVAAFALAENASWLSIGGQSAGSTPASIVVAVDTAGLGIGSYSTTITGSAPGYAASVLQVTLQVEALAECSPLPCSQIRVPAPYQLDWSVDHGRVRDAAGRGTGFTYVDQPSNSVGYLPQKLQLDPAAPGTLNISSTAGIAFSTQNSQDNALAVGVDAPSYPLVIKTRLRSFPATSKQYEQAGIWFGNDEQNYIKFVVISNPEGVRVQMLLESNGLQSRSLLGSVFIPGTSGITLLLETQPTDGTVTALYQVGSGLTYPLATWEVPPELFSFDAAGIDPRIGTNSFAGILTSHRSGAPLTWSFDAFGVTRGVSTAPPPPAGGLAFERVSFPVPAPTSMVWGPDNRLYVTEMMGTIHAITFDAAKRVLADQVITTLGTRLTLGIAVDPRSTPDNVVLLVAHSSPTLNNGMVNSSAVTRLSGSNFATAQTLISGLPRAQADHAINALHFGPDGRLYITLGSNTGAGAPNQANSAFGARAEQPLAAALLVADVNAAGFNGSCAQAEGTFGPPACGVRPFATGIRNAYDFVFHSNGSIYSAVNGLGVTGSFPASGTAPCTGFASTALWSAGGQNPGEQSDLLIKVAEGGYYGHPNPYRNECVYGDGRLQGVAPATNYVAPLYDLGKHRSANGTIEYRSDAFGGALRGELLIANYSIGDDITRVQLSADGRSVIRAAQLAGDFNNPLPLAQGPDGTIYVGEHGGNQVTALVPPGGSAVVPSPSPSPGAVPSPSSGPSKLFIPLADR